MNAMHESYNGKIITGSEVDGMNIIEMKVTGVTNKCKSWRQRPKKHIEIRVKGSAVGKSVVMLVMSLHSLVGLI